VTAHRFRTRRRFVFFLRIFCNGFGGLCGFELQHAEQHRADQFFILVSKFGARLDEIARAHAGGFFFRDGMDFGVRDYGVAGFQIAEIFLIAVGAQHAGKAVVFHEAVHLRWPSIVDGSCDSANAIG
jgi:hypothetical protein